MTFEETASPVFSETIPLTPECLWYNELQYVSNFNLTVQVTDGHKYNDLEQVYFQPWIIKSFDDYFACHAEVSPQVFQFPFTTSFLWLRGRTSHTPYINLTPSTSYLLYKSHKDVQPKCGSDLTTPEHN